MAREAPPRRRSAVRWLLIAPLAAAVLIVGLFVAVRCAV
jgi:hypothetical protein